jgi:AraC family transcriptional regulator of arabinose operon
MDNRIEKILLEIETNFQRAPNIEKIARRLNISVSRFQHLFKKETGVSIKYYVKNLRLKKAGELLVLTHLRVKEVYSAVGINDASLFDH